MIRAAGARGIVCGFFVCIVGAVTVSCSAQVAATATIGPTVPWSDYDNRRLLAHFTGARPNDVTDVQAFAVENSPSINVALVGTYKNGSSQFPAVVLLSCGPEKCDGGQVPAVYGRVDRAQAVGVVDLAGYPTVITGDGQPLADAADKRMTLDVGSMKHPALIVTTRYEYEAEAVQRFTGKKEVGRNKESKIFLILLKAQSVEHALVASLNRARWGVLSNFRYSSYRTGGKASHDGVRDLIEERKLG